MIGFDYRTKKELLASIGQPLSYIETSFFGPEYVEDGVLIGVGPSPSERKWHARVTMQGGKIVKVS
tara:strand:- start:1574 stop:1771 length:198 start_codon:yes stop_codon:yes gene_type:complete